MRPAPIYSSPVRQLTLASGCEQTLQNDDNDDDDDDDFGLFTTVILEHEPFPYWATSLDGPPVAHFFLERSKGQSEVIMDEVGVQKYHQMG